MDPFARSQQQVGGFEVTARHFSQKSEEVDSPALSSLSNQSSGSVVDWAPSHILKQKRRPAKAATYHGIPTQSRRPSNLKARLQKCTTANVKRLDRLTKSAGSEFTSGDESSEQVSTLATATARWYHNVCELQNNFKINKTIEGRFDP